VAAALVPESARTLFYSAWWIAALGQPLNALSFGTDGIHWGTGDFRFLKHVMIVATGASALLLLAVDPASGNALVWIWVITTIWIILRAGLGMARIWPGFGKAPLRLD
jgi:MATE family multidrug resistance protein